MKFTKKEYYARIDELASDIIDGAKEQAEDVADKDELMELVLDSILHETIDSLDWVIYYAYNLTVLMHSDNSEYYAEEFGGDSLVHSLKDGGLQGLHCAFAYWAMYADTLEALQDKLSEL